ncbi:hypothetical protein ABT026_23490 [Streptomyces sp. NPDC002734]|uniref:hypothetical protein n=1 Tax=Streptomyces sp. NPDC002734 TaxID=3154426 RepID=UPI0033341383
MKITPRARTGAVAAAGAAALTLALFTGCGSGAEAAASAPVALSEKELTALGLTGHDLEGFAVEVVRQDRSGAKDQAKPDRFCGPLAQVYRGGAVGTPAAETVRVALPDPDPGADFKEALRVDVTSVNLASYNGQGAQRALRTVADAVEACREWVSRTARDRSSTDYTAVTPRKAVAAKGADEAVAFSLSGKGPTPNSPTTSSVYCQMVRHGNTVVTYVTLNMGKMTDGTPYELDATVVTAQSKKLSRG